MNQMNFLGCDVKQTADLMLSNNEQAIEFVILVLRYTVERHFM